MRGLWCLMAVAALSACVGRGDREAAVSLSDAPSPAAIVAPTPINAGLSAEATLWHVRTGLNVAALACPEPDVVPAYNTLLAQQADALARAEAAYRAQYAAAGGEWRDRYDDDQTRLYNFWSQARGRSALCAAARDSLATLAAAEAAALPDVADVALRRLDQAFAPPWLHVDPQVLNEPSRTMLAVR